MGRAIDTGEVLRKQDRDRKSMQRKASCRGYARVGQVRKWSTNQGEKGKLPPIDVSANPKSHMGRRGTDSQTLAYAWPHADFSDPGCRCTTAWKYTSKTCLNSFQTR